MEHRRIYRILDANFNRAREALRVVEDFARFGLNDRRLAEEARRIRHDLADLMKQLGTANLLAARDTSGDVGRGWAKDEDTKRENGGAVLTAACKRLPEALRSLEEYTRILDRDSAARIEAIRYRFYTLEKALGVRADARKKIDSEKTQLYVLVTTALCRNGDARQTVRAVTAGGAQIVQLREKKMSDRELLGLSRDCAAICRQAGTLFIVNDRPDLTELSGADGVHLGLEDVAPADARRLLGPGTLIGATAHSLEEAEAAASDADYLAVGPMFRSPTKPDLPVNGPELIRTVSRQVNLPLAAIGGITLDNLPEVLTAGAQMVVVCSAVIGMDDPENATRRFRENIMKSA